MHQEVKQHPAAGREEPSLWWFGKEQTTKCGVIDKFAVEREGLK